MKQKLEIWFRGGRKGYSLQKLERSLEIKAENVTESIEQWNDENIVIIKFEIPLNTKNKTEAFYSCCIFAERINPEWIISGVACEETRGRSNSETFIIKDIVYASWAL